MDTKQKTLTNSRLTKEQIKERNQDIFKNYSPALGNGNEFCNKYQISRSRLNQIWQSECKKGNVKMSPRPRIIQDGEFISGFTAEAGTNQQLKELANEMKIGRSELLRRLVKNAIEKYSEGEDQ